MSIIGNYEEPIYWLQNLTKYEEEKALLGTAV